ncbi:LIM/homeobox protein Lhx2 isoform X1 [Camelus ferus]|uniref:LIM/homeobox protein Lhx2 isoform X1 n=1 Tax=Camelus ferus TaxID=419612 RepID=A0A8B8SWE5_CAMFR|nr:LIM/homeobox protein Lhx2 isoform X2 [Camelus dromedarius]XP_032334293.1 LIM/homeobox protein Lhx2 isoform X1 [Camelus ferus]
MLFHSLSGPEVHGVIDEMDRRAKSEAPAISSAIDRGDTETTMPSISSDRAALCAGCGGKISDRYYLLAVDKQWHMRCLKCCECKLNLESELTCFSKDGSIYCKEDYYRRFSVQRCARCHLGISASEMVMRARDLVYHLNCFTCTTCNKMLTTGDHFGMKDSLVYCRLHFEALLQGEYPAHFNHADVAAAAAAAAAAKSAGLGAAGANPLGLPYYNGVGTVQKGRPRKRKSPGPGADLAAYNAALSCNENDAEHLDRDQPYPSSQKTKRMRTSFKHHQLRTMKSYFAINHNPDAKDLKQLAQKTGLTKRVLQAEALPADEERGLLVLEDGWVEQITFLVAAALESQPARAPEGHRECMVWSNLPVIQVWFQNARAKFRRNLLRQENTGVDKSTEAALQTGTPSGPASELSNASLSPSSTPTTLTDLTSPTLPTVTSVLTSVPGNLEGHEPHSPSQTTLTNLF